MLHRIQIRSRKSPATPCFTSLGKFLSPHSRGEKLDRLSALSIIQQTEVVKVHSLSLERGEREGKNTLLFSKPKEMKDM